MMPPRPDILDADEQLGDEDGGVIFLGEKGVLICGCYGRQPRVFPDSIMSTLHKTPQKIERVPGGLDGHEKDWIRSCKDGKPSSSNFNYAGPLTEMVLMGNLAVRFPNRQLLWDGENMRVTNDSAANSYVRRQYRSGWQL